MAHARGYGVITFAIRASLIALVGRIELPPGVRRSLRFIPPAVLMALATPAFLRPERTFNLSLTNAHLVAGVLAAVIAWKTRSTLWTIGIGMASLWILTAVLR